MSKKRIVCFRKKDFQLLKAYQTTPFEIGGIIDASVAGIQRVAMMPGRSDGNSINPDWYPDYSIVFHTHCGNPGHEYENIIKRFAETGKIDINSLVQTISPADLYTTGLFFMEGRANMIVVIAPEGIYFIHKVSDKFVKTPERMKLLKTLSELLDETTEAILDKMIPILQRNFKAEKLPKFQETFALKICKLINKYSNFIKVNYVPWDSENYQKFLLGPLNEDVRLNDLKSSS